MGIASSAGNFDQDQILPVDLDAITHGGITDTNYQILPGDLSLSRGRA